MNEPLHPRAELWACAPGALATLRAGLLDDFGAPTAPRIQRTYSVASVAVVRLAGVLEHRRERDGGVFSGTSTSLEATTSRLRQALADPVVTAIALDIDSPGGPVAGVPELAAELRQARKPIVAVANTHAAGTALWLASQASQFSVTASGSAGGLGVASVHADESGRLAKQGRRMTLIAAGKHKVDGNPYEPLSHDARQHMQREVDRWHAAFVRDVASGRKTSTAHVLAKFGAGRMLGAREAVAAGMADRVETLEQAIERLQRGGTAPRRSGARARAFAAELGFS